VIPKVLSHVGFEALLHCLHVIDNDSLETDRSHPKYDKIGKVRFIVDHFVKRSKKPYNLGRYITVDEMLVAYRGHYFGFR